MDQLQRPSNDSLLSAHRIATAAARDKESWLSDNHGLRGAGRLLLRVGRGGGSRFYFRSSKDGRRQVVPLGPYSRTAREGFLTLEQARALTVSSFPSSKGTNVSSSDVLRSITVLMVVGSFFKSRQKCSKLSIGRRRSGKEGLHNTRSGEC